MKQLELNLQKRLLIVEGASEIVVGQYELDVNGRDIELICKGSELTEEIAENFVEGMMDSYYIDNFISAIEAQGYYWGENPIEEPIMHQLLGADDNPNSEEKEWQEAESKTFNPEKTLIFEILL